MTRVTDFNLPPIADEDRFEDFCCELWGRIWDDPNTQRHGRKGQSQKGVDVYGRPNQGVKYAGVQAKAYKKPLTEAEIKHEIDVAKGFTPPLKELVIATTAPKDTHSEQIVREITADPIRQSLFPVTIVAWGDILRRLEDYPDLIEKYFQLRTASSVLEERIVAAVHQTAADLRVDLLGDVQNQEYQQELNFARSLVNGFKPLQALDYLTDCRIRFWHTAQPLVRYRILHYTGTAHYMLGHYQEAAHAFLEALQYNPDDETSLTHAAQGHLLLEDRANAIALAKQVLSRNPANAKARAFLLHAASPGQSLTALVASVPQPYRSLPEVANAFAHLARDGGELEEAEKWVREGIKHDQESWADLYGVLGEILLHKATRTCPDPLLFQLDDQKKIVLEEAVSAFDTAWAKVEGTEIAKTRVLWLANRAMTKRLLGDVEGAAEDLDLAIRHTPDNVHFVQGRAHLAFEQNDLPLGVRLLEGFLPAPDHPELYFMLASALSQLERYGEAEEVLQQLSASHSQPEIETEIQRLYLEIALQRKDYAKAKVLLESMLLADSTSLELLTEAAHIARLTDKRGEGMAHLAKARGCLTAETAPRQLLMLAQEWLNYDEYAEAATLYERLADRNVNSRFTRSLLSAYYHSGQLGRALDIALHLTACHGPLPAVSGYLAAIYEEIGDLQSSRAVTEAYLEKFPDDFPMQLRLAHLCLRLRDTECMDRFLDTPINTQVLSLEDAMRVASIQGYRNRFKEAIHLAYETRRRHKNNSRAHLFYVNLFFNMEKRQEEWLHPNKVREDTAVRLRDEAGAEEWHILEKREDGDIPKELALSHPLAQTLLDKAVGEKVLLRENPYSKEEGTIVEIQSKFVRALQESMTSFEKMFPDAEGLWAFKLGLREGAEDDAAALQPILDMVSRRHEHYLNVEQLYREGQITLGMFAKMAGWDVLSLWARAMYRPELGIRCTIDPNEMEKSLKLLTERPTLVADVIAVATLHGLDCREEVMQSVGPVGVTQSTIDYLHLLAEERKGFCAKGFLTVGKEDDDFIREEITPEHIERNIAWLEELLDWIDRHCQVLPVSAALETERAYREHLEELMDQSFVDTLLVASEPGKFLYSDDERLRALARGEWKTESVWTQSLLRHALVGETVSRESYNKEVIKLITSQYYRTYMDEDIIIEAARQAEWRPAPPYTRIVRVLEGGKYEDASAIDIAVNGIYGLWKERLMDHQRQLLLFPILSAVTSGRNKPLVLRTLVQRIRQRFRFLYFQGEEAIGLIQAWMRTRIL